jgi:hypothetical protein
MATIRKLIITSVLLKENYFQIQGMPRKLMKIISQELVLMNLFSLIIKHLITTEITLINHLIKFLKIRVKCIYHHLLNNISNYIITNLSMILIIRMKKLTKETKYLWIIKMKPLNSLFKNLQQSP